MEAPIEYQQIYPPAQDPDLYEWYWIREHLPPNKGIYAVVDPIESPDITAREWDGEKWEGFGNPHPYKTTVWSYLLPPIDK